MTRLVKIHRGKLVATAIILCVWLYQTSSAAEQVLDSSPAQPVIFNFAPYLQRLPDFSRVAPFSTSLTWNAANAETGRVVPGNGPRRITLDQAQQEAAAAANPLLRLGALGVEAAKQRRLGVQADFFPKVTSSLMNVHFNKFLGEFLTVPRPRFNSTSTFALPIFNKDQTLVAANVMQPITPLFKLRQALTIAHADENIARAKASVPLTETAANVEQAYFALLVAQCRKDAADADLRILENRWRLASVSTAAGGRSEYEDLEASKALVVADSNVKQATAALNALLGWPLETELVLVVPSPFYESISRSEATERALRNNPEIIEAEQTVIKARAAATLSKLEYVPDFAVVGGYAYQSIMPSLPGDFSYLGIMGNYTLFDFGKRERSVKERNAQVAMAETGLALVRAKVAAGVTKAYYDLDRARQIKALTRRINALNRTVDANYGSDDAKGARARSESEMFQAEIEHRMAFSRLQQFMGDARN